MPYIATAGRVTVVRNNIEFWTILIVSTTFLWLSMLCYIMYIFHIGFLTIYINYHFNNYWLADARHSRVLHLLGWYQFTPGIPQCNGSKGHFTMVPTLVGPWSSRHPFRRSLTHSLFQTFWQEQSCLQWSATVIDLYGSTFDKLKVMTLATTVTVVTVVTTDRNKHVCKT